MRALGKYMSMELDVCHDRQQIHAKHTKEDLSVRSRLLALLLSCVRWSSHALGSFLAEDASYGNAEAKEKKLDRYKGEAGE